MRESPEEMIIRAHHTDKHGMVTVLVIFQTRRLALDLPSCHLGFETPFQQNIRLNLGRQYT